MTIFTFARRGSGGVGPSGDWSTLVSISQPVAATTFDSGTFAAMDYLRGFIRQVPSGGTLSTGIRFNGDAGANYAERFYSNGVNGTQVSRNQAESDAGGATSNTTTIFFWVDNKLDEIKSVFIESTTTGASAASAPSLLLNEIAWHDTTAQITELNLIRLAGTGNYGTESHILVEGRND